MIRGDFHVHTNYSDGNNSPEEMVQKAISLGFTALGFTDHAVMDDERDWGMTREQADAYFAEVNALKEKYRDQIEILCGIEQDYYSPDPTDRFDYVIASVHGMKCGDHICEVDDSAEMFLKAVCEDYNGDVYALIEDYYSHLEQVAEKIPCAIIGHIDLVTKFQEIKPLFDESHPRYVAAAEKAVRRLAKSGALFEVNCGAMSRGCRTTPYPAPRWLKLIRELGGEVIITGDCHNADLLGKGFDQALDLVRSCGFSRVAALTGKGRVYIGI